MKEVIKALLAEWAGKKLHEIQEREVRLDNYLQRKLKKIIVITGFRRVGKTYLMLKGVQQLLHQHTPENVIYLNFEDERIPLKTEFLTSLIPTIKEMQKEEIKYLFLDEIQTLPLWSKWLRRIYDNYQIQLVVSGSSSKMSSKEIPTELRGRFLEIQVFPLCFMEFLSFRKIILDFKAAEHAQDEKAKVLQILDEYITGGGLPEIALHPYQKEELAQSYYQTIIRKDIIERHNIKNQEALKALLQLLLNSKEYTVSKLHNSLKSAQFEIGKATLQNYISYIENSYFMFSLKIFSYKIKDRLQHPRKIYCIDNIFLTVFAEKQSSGHGRLYENLVAVQLTKKHPENVFYWRNQEREEIDFVVTDGIKAKELIQVCYSLTDIDTKKREVRALLKASKELNCKDLLIITHDYDGEETAEWFGIKEKINYISLWKWLLMVN